MRIVLSILILALSARAATPPCDPLDLEIADPSRDLENVLSFLVEFKTARESVEKLRRKLKDREVSLVPTSEAKPGQTRVKDPASLFDFPDGRATIYLDAGELGVVAPLLLHESVHALDEIYAERYATWRPESLRLADEFENLVRGTLAWQDWQNAATESEKRRHRMVFEAERPAFDAQQALIEELMGRFACAREYYAHHEKAEHLVARKVGDADLIRLYRLKREWTVKN